MRRLFAIEGLACAGCARGLETRVRGLSGVRSAGVHFLTASMFVDRDENSLAPGDLSISVRRTGHVLIDGHRPVEIAARLAAQVARIGIRLAVALVAGMWSMALALVLHLTDLDRDTAWWLAVGSGVFALPVVFWTGAPFRWMAWRSLRLRTPGMNLLVSIWALSATILSGITRSTGSGGHGPVHPHSAPTGTSGCSTHRDL